MRVVIKIFGEVSFLIVAVDFINVANGGGVVATINLQSFVPAKGLDTTDMSLSDNGSRLCILYGDGSISVVDRKLYLREYPRRQSWAFQYTAEDGRETPSSIAESFEKPAREFSISPYQSRSPSVLSNLSEDAEEESLSLAGLERKQAMQRSASACAKHLPDIVPVWRRRVLDSESCPTLSPKTAFFRVESNASIFEEADASGTDAPDCSQIASPRIGQTSEAGPGLLSLGPSQCLAQSKTCPTFSPLRSCIADTGQETAACCHFRLPYWNDRAQCRKMVWTKSRLFIWLSVHNALGVEEHVVLLFSLSNEKLFSHRYAFEYMPFT